MLMIQPVPYERLQELCRQNGAPASMFCCEATENGQSRGFIMFDSQSGTLKVTALCCSADLADALLRAGFNAGNMVGMKRFVFTPQVMEVWRSTLRALDYPLDGGDIEEFFSRGCRASQLAK
jgi:hypothetical protein